MISIIITYFKHALIILIFLLGAVLAINALTYANFDFTYGFLRLKQDAIRTGWYLPGYYAHVLTGGLILVIGFFQIHPTLGSKWPKIHRSLGYCYVMGILFFAAPGGLLMSLFINRGPYVLISFLLQGFLWIYFTAIAFTSIRKRSVVRHQQFMFRSFSLTLAAITLRIYIFICSYSIDLSSHEAYATLAWLSWVPNIIIVEWYIRRKGATRKRAVL